MSGTDPLSQLSAVLSAKANSKEQADLLATLRESLEANQAPIPILVNTLITGVANGADSLLKRWVIDLVHFGICRSSLSLETRTTISTSCLDVLARLLNEPNISTVKVAIQCLTTVYPLLFRVLCTSRNAASSWETLTRCKNRILEFVHSPDASLGVKLSAMKFMQRVILVQTRGVSDPRLQKQNDPNISFCPADHPYISVTKLESEGQKLLEGVIAILYQSRQVDVLSAMLNSWATLIKMRPALVPLIVSALQQWTPKHLIGLPASSIKSVEKSIRILLTHLGRIPANGPYMAQITETLAQQGIRMDKASAEEKKRRSAIAESNKRVAEGNKRVSSTADERPSEAKRPKLEQDTSNTSAAFLASFDFTSLPASLITDLIVANLEAFSETVLVELVDAYRRSLGIAVASAAVPPPQDMSPPEPQSTTSAPVIAPSPVHAQPPAPDIVPRSEPSAAPTKEEPIDPLYLNIEEEELEYEPDRLNMQLSGDIPPNDNDTVMPDANGVHENDMSLVDFKLPPPKDLLEEDRTYLIRNSLTRIWDGAADMRKNGDIPVETSRQGGSSGPAELWMLLIIRMVTRVVEPPPSTPDETDEGEKRDEEAETALTNFYARQDRLRQTLCDYIMADFPSRVRLATTWMNEEWYNDNIRMEKDREWQPNYDTWLNQIVASYQTLLDAKDPTFARFLLDLPAVPTDVMGLLRDLCVDPERMVVGFTTLRGLVVQRPSLRTEALRVLLELTTHPEKVTRAAAINTVKTWMPHTQPMASMIREFALQMLRKLQITPTPEEKPANPTQDVEMENTDTADTVKDDTDTPADVTLPEVNGDKPDENMEDGQLPLDDLVQTPYLPERVELPAQKAHVLQHVELLFVLSVKVPEFLDEIFGAYSHMDVTVQEAIQQLITALIRSLGSSHGKLLTLMRTCPPGAESLALRVLTIFTEQGRPGAQLVALVKALINERDLDARFLIPIIAEMDKADIMRHLPRIVSILNGQTEPKGLVRSVFTSVVTAPPQSFGSVTSNMPRVRQSELLTPAELMVMLHDSEKEIGLKSAIEAIGICFSMTTVFKPEVFGVVMQQIMDEPVLPVLFLRTVIQAVTTYKSLVGFVSTTLLSRLITKKIWTNPPLWEGFIRCAKVIAPASFGALLQLPKDQLRELVDKQPSLKSGLRDYLTKKAGNKARAVAGFMDIFGEEEPAPPVAETAPTEPPSTLAETPSSAQNGTPQFEVQPELVPASPA